MSKEGATGSTGMGPGRDAVFPRQASLPSFTLTLALILTFVVTLILPSTLANDNCQLIPVRESIVKEMTLSHSNRNLQVSCTAELELHKCEGQCESTVTPSVRRHAGFRKDCKCCKERMLETRTVVLPRCYHDSELVQGLQGTTEVVDLKSCGCLSCSN